MSNRFNLKYGKKGKLIGTDNEGYQEYLYSIKEYTPLEKEEEKELFIKYYDPNTSDIEKKRIRDRIILSNLRSVISIAKQYCIEDDMITDLIQEGNIGLITAFERFDINRNVRFYTYATQWIIKYILIYLNKHNELYKIEFIDKIIAIVNAFSKKIDEDWLYYKVYKTSPIGIDYEYYSSTYASNENINVRYIIILDYLDILFGLFPKYDVRQLKNKTRLYLYDRIYHTMSDCIENEEIPYYYDVDDVSIKSKPTKMDITSIQIYQEAEKSSKHDSDYFICNMAIAFFRYLYFEEVVVLFETLNINISISCLISIYNTLLTMKESDTIKDSIFNPISYNITCIKNHMSIHKELIYGRLSDDVFGMIKITKKHKFYVNYDDVIKKIKEIKELNDILKKIYKYAQ